MQPSPSRVGALVIVTGLPATGKSTLVAALTARTGIAVLAKDTIKEALFERHGTGDAGASRRMSDAAFAEMFARVVPPLRRGEPVALEGNFRPGEHESSILAALGAAAGATSGTGPARTSPRAETIAPPPVAQVLCRIDEIYRLARLRERVASGRRHPGHRDVQLLAALESGATPRAGAAGDRFLDLPGLRLVYDPGPGSGLRAALERVLADLERWVVAAQDRGTPPGPPPSRGE